MSFRKYLSKQLKILQKGEKPQRNVANVNIGLLIQYLKRSCQG